MIIDFHCDLLYYLLQAEHRADHPEVRCSWPQLEAGGVGLQVLALYSETNAKAPLLFQKQVDIYQNLPTLYPGHFIHWDGKTLLENKGVYTLAAIENASGLMDEHEPFAVGLRRLEECLELCAPVLYLSLTWNGENRFGGGNHTQVGLKEEGAQLLEALDGRGVAIDLSHASDRLAFDILEYIDRHGLSLVPIASHSNFRSVFSHPRNLPEALAQQIVLRGGIIGLNLVRHFIGTPFAEAFTHHVRYALDRGWGEHLCLGADFFYDQGFPSSILPPPFFDETYGDARCYPALLTLLADMPLEKERIASRNALAFFARQRLGSYVTCR